MSKLPMRPHRIAYLILLAATCHPTTAQAHGGPGWLYAALAMAPFLTGVFLFGLLLFLGYNLYRYSKRD